MPQFLFGPMHWPEQILNKLIRPVALFGRSSAERAKETERAA